MILDHRSTSTARITKAITPWGYSARRNALVQRTTSGTKDLLGDSGRALAVDHPPLPGQTLLAARVVFQVAGRVEDHRRAVLGIEGQPLRQGLAVGVAAARANGLFGFAFGRNLKSI